jgi:hypothetical protein
MLAPVSLNAFRSMLAVPSTISCPERPSRSATEGPGQELQVVDRLGEVRPKLTAAGDAPGGEEVLPDGW